MRTAHCDCVLQVLHKIQKASEKALADPRDHLERSLRPIQATQVTPGPFWTRQKKTREAFWTSNKNLATWNLFSIEGAPQFTEHLKRLWAGQLWYSSGSFYKSTLWPLLQSRTAGLVLHRNHSGPLLHRAYVMQGSWEPLVHRCPALIALTKKCIRFFKKSQQYLDTWKFFISLCVHQSLSG